MGNLNLKTKRVEIDKITEQNYIYSGDMNSFNYQHNNHHQYFIDTYIINFGVNNFGYRS